MLFNCYGLRFKWIFFGCQSFSANAVLWVSGGEVLVSEKVPFVSPRFGARLGDRAFLLVLIDCVMRGYCLLCGSFAVEA